MFFAVARMESWIRRMGRSALTTRRMSGCTGVDADFAHIVLGTVDTLEAIVGTEMLVSSVYPLVCRATRDVVYWLREAVVQQIHRARFFHSAKKVTFPEICTYWRSIFFWKVQPVILPSQELVPSSACLVHMLHKDRRSVACVFDRYRMVIPVIDGLTMQFVARTKGDITLLHIPALVELCHGYEKDPALSATPLVCVKIERVGLVDRLMYGKARSDGSLHVYTLHVNCTSCRLIVDDWSVTSNACPDNTAFPRRCPLVAQIGCNARGNYPCHECELIEMRIVLESRLSELTASAHAGMFSHYVTSRCESPQRAEKVARPVNVMAV